MDTFTCTLRTKLLMCVQSNIAVASGEEAAIAAFCNKFKGKTGNAWDTRLSAFVAKVGK